MTRKAVRAALQFGVGHRLGSKHNGDGFRTSVGLGFEDLLEDRVSRFSGLVRSGGSLKNVLCFHVI